MINIAVSGASGRMGQRIIALINQSKDLKLSGAIEKSGAETIGKAVGNDILITDNAADVIKNSDVLIEFSNPEATIRHLDITQKLSKKIVIGTTALSNDDVETIRQAAKTCSVLLSPNMSLGVNILFKLTGILTDLLADKGFDIEIVEAHHRNKVDAPSGTAGKIADIVAEHLGISLTDNGRYGRHGVIGKRTGSEIGIHSIRGGDIVGDHKVIYAGDGEILEISHRATSRDTFAAGALEAARFLCKQKAGLYSTADLLK
ncbi:MAG: 4-hydroxy-tetrahydrodipicolinate reductase [Epsilonproteobacteria bacterium]|nr:4-hydroxy-tetrahydrodipicolinate reductase [Campylobacterota bacterium]